MIAVIDGQGGNLGRQLVKLIREAGALAAYASCL